MTPRFRSANTVMRFYKNGTDVSRITSDVDPVNWHVVAQDRTTWKSTMLIDVPTNLALPTTHTVNATTTR